MTTQKNTYGGLLTVQRDGDTTRLELDGTYGIVRIEVTPTDGVIVTHTDGSETLADPKSPHFLDQAQHYADGNLRPVYFHPEELSGHVERVYRPGQ